MPTYSLLLILHVSCVVASVVSFVVRWAAGYCSFEWRIIRVLRRLSYVVDTLLLVAGLSLAVLSHRNPASTPWLMAKLLLLPVYIVLGSFAIKRARSRRTRLGCFLAAIIVLLMIVSIAVTRQPLGYFQF